MPTQTFAGTLRGRSAEERGPPYVVGTEGCTQLRGVRHVYSIVWGKWLTEAGRPPLFSALGNYRVATAVTRYNSRCFSFIPGQGRLAGDAIVSTLWY